MDEPKLKVTIINYRESDFDEGAALALKDMLISNDIFVYHYDLLPGQNKSYSFNSSLKSSDHAIIVCSQSLFGKSGSHLSELKKAKEKWDESLPSARFVIPVLIDDCSDGYGESFMRELRPLDLTKFGGDNTKILPMLR